MKGTATWLVLMVSLCWCPKVVAEAPSDYPFSGVWQTRGYGYIFLLEGPEVRIFETAGARCYTSVLDPGALTQTPGRGATVPVQVPGFIEAEFRISQRADGSLLLDRSDTLTAMVADPLDALPSACTADTPTDIATSLEVLFDIFDEHYPFFQEMHVTWERDLLRRELAAARNDEDVFFTFRGLLAALRDPHVVLVAPDLNAVFWETGQVDGEADFAAQVILKEVAENYTAGLLTPYCGGSLAKARLKSGVTYLKVSAFLPCQDSVTGQPSSEQFAADLNKIFADADSWSGLVLDVRANQGGSDVLMRALADRLIGAGVELFRKQAALDFAQSRGWTAPQEIQTSADSRVVYTGPAVALTDVNTLSAGETFLMALEARTPEVRRVGGRTRGAFSDILPRRLPNGWLLGLPNERYLDKAGRSYDILGLKPHVEVRETSADIDENRDVILEAGLRLLSEQ